MRFTYLARLPIVLSALVLDAAEPLCEGVVTVRLSNHARLEHRILKAAQRQFDAILNEAGAAAAWLDCSAQHRKLAGCSAPVGTLDVVMNLLPRAMARKAEQTNETFGFSVPTRPTGLGIANIFTDRVNELAFQGPFSTGHEIARSIVLGHVMAHEIGHLLLGPNSHSPTGIMSPRWANHEVRRLATTTLHFTRSEASAIRGRLASCAPTRTVRSLESADPEGLLADTAPFPQRH